MISLELDANRSPRSRITEVLGYSTDELVGESLYTLCHGEDALKIRKCHSDCKLLAQSDPCRVLITFFSLQ
jgi:PAS fold